MGVDLFAAGIPSYYNPLLDLPYYLLAIVYLPAHPLVVGFLTGLPTGMLAFLVWLVIRKILHDLGWRGLAWHLLTAAAVLYGMTGAAGAAQLGTTFNEVQVAVMVLAGITALVYGFDGGRLSVRGSFYAGMCLGLATGLKMTAFDYAMGTALAILFTTYRQQRLGAMLVYCCGCVLSFLLIFGWWGWRLYHYTGDPLFPLLPGVFHSDLLRGVNILAFRPQSLLQYLAYPFYWLRTNTLVSEIGMADPRFAFAAVAIIAVCCRGLFYRRDPALQPVLPASAKLILSYVGFSYYTWEFLFSIYRYTVAMECLSGLVLLIAIAQYLPLMAAAKRPQFLTMVVVYMAITATVLTHVPFWGRCRYFTATYALLQPIKLEPYSLVVLNGIPLSYVAPLFDIAGVAPVGVRYEGIVPEIGTDNFSGLRHKLRHEITTYTGPVYIVEHPYDQDALKIMQDALGITPTKDCQDIYTNVDDPLKICREATLPVQHLSAP